MEFCQSTPPITELAAKNPQFALEWAARLGPERYFPPLLVGWAASDWEAAIGWLKQQPNAAEVLAGTAEYLADHRALYQPRLFDLIVASLPAGNSKAELVRRVLEELAFGDPVRATAEAERALPDREMRAEALAEIAKHLARSNPSLAWDLLSRADQGATGERRLDLPTAEVIVDGVPRNFSGPASYQWDLVRCGAGETTDDVKSEVLDSLIWTDKAQALLLLERCPPDKIAIIGERMIDNWASYDPIEAATWLATKAGGSGECLEVADWFYNSNLTPKETTELIDTLAPGVFRDAFVAWAAGRMVDEDPAAALAVARANGGNAAAIAEVYDDWAAKDPEAALGSLAIDDGAPSAAWASATKRALTKDPEQTTRLIEEMAPGANRDAALKVLATDDRNRTNSRQRAAWACDITDETDRRRILNGALDDMILDLRVARDPPAADSLREMFEAAEVMSADEKARWSARLDLLFQPSP